jgi:hypothetical protein
MRVDPFRGGRNEYAQLAQSPGGFEASIVSHRGHRVQLDAWNWQIGDIIAVARRPGLWGWLVGWMITVFQGVGNLSFDGCEWIHVAIYVGDGVVADIAKGSKPRQRPIAEALSGRTFVVMRFNNLAYPIQKHQIEAAVQENQTVAFSALSALPSWINPRTVGGIMQKRREVVCSSAGSILKLPHRPAPPV